MMSRDIYPSCTSTEELRWISRTLEPKKATLLRVAQALVINSRGERFGTSGPMLPNALRRSDGASI